MKTLELLNIQKGRLIFKIIAWVGIAFTLLHQFKVLRNEAWETVGFSLVMLGGSFIILSNNKIANKKLAIIGLSSFVAIALILYYIVYVRNI